MITNNMQKLYDVASQNSRYLVYIDDGSVAGLAYILKGEDGRYYYQFYRDDESVVRDLSTIKETDIAVYKLDEGWRV